MPARIAVIGSCVSRDVLNRQFIPDYKTEAAVVDTTYQSSLPSLVREFDIYRDPPNTVRPNFIKTMKKEFLGNKLARIALSQPDALLVDLFADVHFGVTTVDGLSMTRNHMAFQTLKDADEYFQDDGVRPPERMRYSADTAEGEYREVALSAMKNFRDFWRRESPGMRIILNSARFSANFIDESNEHNDFSNVERLREKNENWSEIDDLFLETIDCERITHDSSYFVSSVNHPWGLHPVHYSQPYYDHLWQSLTRVIGQRKA